MYSQRTNSRIMGLFTDGAAVKSNVSRALVVGNLGLLLPSPLIPNGSSDWHTAANGTAL
jgi:hypothetical protein